MNNIEIIDSKDCEGCIWVNSELEKLDRMAVIRELLVILQNEAAAVGLLRALGALREIAIAHEDSEGQEGCTGAIRALGHMRMYRERILRDFFEQENAGA